MRTRMVLLALTLGLALPPAALAADGDEVDVSDLPAAVRKAADKALPKAEWSRAFKLAKSKHPIYQLQGKDARGRRVELESTADGRVIEYETRIAMDDVPPVVASALKARMPRFKPDVIEEITKNGKVVSYGFEGEDAEGKEVEVYLSADGKTVLNEES